MGIEVAVLAIAAVGTGYSINQQQKAKEAQKDAAREQKKIRNEQRAQNEAQAAQERRKQIREERIRRAKILSSSQAAGTIGSSGEAGALGSLTTQLSSNLGTNLAAINSAANISLFSQNAANFMSAADQANANAQMAGQISSLAFQAAPTLEKAGSLFSTAPVAKTTP